MKTKMEMFAIYGELMAKVSETVSEVKLANMDDENNIFIRVTIDHNLEIHISKEKCYFKTLNGAFMEVDMEFVREYLELND